jgi:flagellin-like protein
MKRKGITPVIAVVLLLLITVGAVASAWGLYQNIISDQSQLDQLNAQQMASNTNIEYNSVYESRGGYLMMDIENTGQRAINVSRELSFQAAPDGSSGGLDFSTFKRRYNNTRYGTWNSTEVDQGLDCIENNPSSEVLETSNTMNCNTTIQFPGATQEVGLVINYRGVDNKEWSYSCVPETSDTVTC